jgi:hypothetical protein
VYHLIAAGRFCVLSAITNERGYKRLAYVQSFLSAQLAPTEARVLSAPSRSLAGVEGIVEVVLV